jgi:hypothetical protein
MREPSDFTPHVQAATFCDQVIRGKDDVLTMNDGLYRQEKRAKPMPDG